MRRRLAAAVLVAGIGATLSACSSVHESLGTSNAPCFVALPTATRAAGSSAHLSGVRLLKVSAVGYHKLAAALEQNGVESGRVCLVAFTGRFTARSVSHPSGRASGRFAVVLLRYPSGTLVSTVLFGHAPVRFGHSHFG
jgi:hypothetical protein